MKRVLLSLVLWMSAVGAHAETKLLDFYADWCGPCQEMTSTVDAIAQEGYTVQKVNITEQPKLAEQYGVTAVPCYVAVEDGNEVGRVLGLTTKAKLRTLLRPASGVRVKVKQKPTPAWRYERPLKHRAAVVRVICLDRDGSHSYGSGVLVRWGKRVVVLTARHVIQDATRIMVRFHTGRQCRAKLIQVDRQWDCAVLEITPPMDVEPAEVALGQSAMFREGDRLESCGYGPDGQLACNTGRFLGYRGSTQTGNVLDWLAISGHSRGGDSGGPMFNAEGKVVGVVWGGTSVSNVSRDAPRVAVVGAGDGPEVYAVQAGRMHRVLDNAAKVTYAEQKAAKPEYLPQRPLVAVPEARIGDKNPLLPWRGDSETRDREFEERLNGLLTAQERERQARIVAQGGGTSVDVQVGRRPEGAVEPEPAPTPLGVALCLAGALLVGVVVFYGVQKN